MKVKCIDTPINYGMSGSNQITLGNVYDVIYYDMEDDNIGITNDFGVRGIFPKVYFEIINNEEVFDEKPQQPTIGVKHDSDKLRWNLVNMQLLEQFVRGLMFGANKYAPGNYQKVDNAEERYYEAAIRHLSACQNIDGSMNLDARDPESGLPHIAHAMCCVYFMEYFRHKKVGEV